LREPRNPLKTGEILAKFIYLILFEILILLFQKGKKTMQKKSQKRRTSQTGFKLPEIIEKK